MENVVGTEDDAVGQEETLEHELHANDEGVETEDEAQPNTEEDSQEIGEPQAATVVGSVDSFRAIPFGILRYTAIFP